MSTIDTMMCPRCGTAMTCHAEKPCEPRTREEAAEGAVIEQVHECPGCGMVTSRRFAAW